MRTSTKALAGAAAVATSGLAAFAASRILTRHPRGNAHVPEPAKSVDLERYLGHWHEIARYEQRFERGCRAATADYALYPDGRIEVVNWCRKRNADARQARGVARVIDGETNAKLKVRFFGPFEGDYWILDRADDYSWSIVGEPSGRYLWLLARDPHPAAEQLDSLIARAAELGYDTSMLVFDTH